MKTIGVRKLLNEKEGEIIQLSLEKYSLEQILRTIPRICRLNYRGIQFKILPGLETGGKELLLVHNINEVFKKTKVQERYEFIYDTVWKELDDLWNVGYFCQFSGNICERHRKTGLEDHRDGCCNGKSRGVCSHLKNGRCEVQSIACKLFTCRYLEKKGIRFRVRDFPLLNYFFNRKQKEVLTYQFFRTKEETIDELMRYRTKDEMLRFHF